MTTVLYAILSTYRRVVRRGTDDHGLVPCAPALLINTEGKPAVTSRAFDSVFPRLAQLFIRELTH